MDLLNELFDHLLVDMHNSQSNVSLQVNKCSLDVKKAAEALPFAHNSLNLKDYMN